MFNIASYSFFVYLHNLVSVIPMSPILYDLAIQDQRGSSD